ncbi:PAS domain S-box protein [Proteobacteria bacterium 005FR1]|nr:PAS domain S-box protein [Proteobacteria bacterium 005FR1]
MSVARRPDLTPGLRAQIALAAVRASIDLDELAERYCISPAEIIEYRDRLLAGAESLFEGSPEEGQPISAGATDGFFSKVLDSLFAFVGILDIDGTLLQVNSPPLRAAELTSDQVIGKYFWDCYWWTYSEAVSRDVRAACARAAAGEVVRYDVAYRGSGNSRPIIDFQLAPLKDQHGKVFRLVASAVDVTARKQQEEELRQRAEEVEKLMDIVPVAVFISRDVECRKMVGNQQAVQLYEADRDENLSADGSRRRFLKDGREMPAEALPMQIAAANNCDVRGEEIDVILPSGRRFSIWGSATPLRDRNGQVRGAVGAFVESTERKKAEEALRESEQRFRALAELSPDATLVHMDGTFAYANAAALRLLGAAKVSDLVGRSPFDFIDPSNHDLVRERIRRVHNGESVPVIEQPWQNLDGRNLELEISAASTRWRGRAAIQILLRDVSERKRAERALRNSERRLREADRRKDEFLAMLAHELRNPLAPIRNAVALIEPVLEGDPQQRQVLDILKRQTGTLSALVDDLLDVSRITRGFIKLKRQPVMIADLVSHALESAAGSIDLHQHQVEVSIPDQALHVMGDPLRLEQAVVNLLTNAAKYTPSPGRIWITVETHGGEVALKVRDNGIGIAPESIAQIFNLFGQANRELDRSQGGLGVGLTISRTLVELQGGSIDVSSAGIGHGAEFIISLPLTHSPEAPPVAPAVPTDSGSRRVLLVDDNRDAADTLAMLLEAMGHHSEVAYSGEEGLQKAWQNPPDIIFLDIGLPGMDGYEVARRLRQDERSRDVTIVALTGYGQAQDRRCSQEAGFDEHLVKPVSTEELIGLLSNQKTSEFR